MTELGNLKKELREHSRLESILASLEKAMADHRGSECEEGRALPGLGAKLKEEQARLSAIQHNIKKIEHVIKKHNIISNKLLSSILSAGEGGVNDSPY